MLPTKYDRHMLDISFFLIVDVSFMWARGVRGVLVMNPVYLDEVRQIMRALGPNVVVVA